MNRSFAEKSFACVSILLVLLVSAALFGAAMGAVLWWIGF